MGKRDYLRKHSSLKLNGEVIVHHERGWADDDIRARGAELTDHILATRRRPVRGPATQGVLVTARPAAVRTPIAQHFAYRLTTPAGELGPMPRRTLVRTVVDLLVDAGVPLEEIARVLGSDGLTSVPGTLVGDDLWAQIREALGVPDRARANWDLDHPIQSDDRSWVLRSLWGRASDAAIDRLAGLGIGLAVHRQTAEKPSRSVGWAIDDVREAAAEDPDLLDVIDTLREHAEALGGGLAGTAAATPSMVVYIPAVGGTSYPYNLQTNGGDPEIWVQFPLRLVPEDDREAFADRLGEVVAGFPAEEVKQSGFMRQPVVDAAVLTPALANDLGAALALIAASGAGAGIWWGIHNDRLEQELVDGGFVSVDWGLGDLNDIGDDADAIKNRLVDRYPGEAPGAYNWAGILRKFAFDMQPGDHVVAPTKSTSTLKIGVVDGPYYFDADADEHLHRRPVRWLRTDVPRSALSQSALNELGSALTLFQVRRHVGELAAIFDDTRAEDATAGHDDDGHA